MGNVANKKKAASINQRRKGGGIASANSETKTNNELFQAELPVHYNNLAVGYNSFNITPSGDGAVHGHILFYDQMTSVQYTPPADDVVGTCVCLNVSMWIVQTICFVLFICPRLFLRF